MKLHAAERCEKNGWTCGRIAFNPRAGVALRRLPIVKIYTNPSTYLGGRVKNQTPYTPRSLSKLHFHG
jgi:hypothetical protein